MKGKVHYLMSQEQLKRYTVIEKTLEGSMTIREAAEHLGLSVRQVIRLKKGVKENGAASLIHKNQGRKPAHAITDDMKKTIISLKLSERYKDANFKHFQELLERFENIKISYSPLMQSSEMLAFKAPKNEGVSSLTAVARERRKRVF